MRDRARLQRSALPINDAALAIFLPWFELLNWSSFLLGLVESFADRLCHSLIIGPPYNFFAIVGDEADQMLGE